MSQLESLSLSGGWVTDAGREHLTGPTDLEELNLNHAEITDTGLSRLKELKKLHTLWLYAPKVTEAGVKELQEASPKEKKWQKDEGQKDGMSSVLPWGHLPARHFSALRNRARRPLGTANSSRAAARLASSRIEESGTMNLGPADLS